MKLYEISEMYHDFMFAYENGEIPEEAFKDTLDAIEGTFLDKVDNVACMIKSYEAEAAAIKEEEVKLAERRKRKQAQADGLKSYLSSHMLAMGVMNAESPRARLSFRRSEAVEIVNEPECAVYLQQIGRDDFLTYQAPKINKTALKAAIKNGEEFIGVQLVERQNLQLK